MFVLNSVYPIYWHFLFCFEICHEPNAYRRSTMVINAIFECSDLTTSVTSLITTQNTNSFFYEIINFK